MALSFEHVQLGWGQTGTATVTIPLFVARKAGKLEGADYCAQNATDGAKTVQLVNSTSGVNLTNALSVNGVSALTKAAFVLATTNTDMAVGDVISAVYTVTTAGTVQPGEIAIQASLRHAPSGDTIAWT